MVLCNHLYLSGQKKTHHKILTIVYYTTVTEGGEAVKQITNQQVTNNNC